MPKSMIHEIESVKMFNEVCIFAEPLKSNSKREGCLDNGRYHFYSSYQYSWLGFLSVALIEYALNIQ
jgi:hypothetical protein